ncbi:hypothetical protein AN958_06125 [Leucoagaricus sp. SymC.cos]|nr:hypothetical protein AN958_06125 [Leucoagaricus sp. SymC.cos]
MSQHTQSTFLLDLPPEILTHILLFLPSTNVLTCHLVNRYLHKLITGSVEIRYYLAGQLTGQIDNPRSTLDIAERLDRLAKREKRWDYIEPTFAKTKVDVPFFTSGIYDLTGGVYLLGESSRKVLHYMYLPTTPDEEVVWKEVRTKHPIIDMGLCVYEHDLLAIVTTQPVEFDPLTGSALSSNHDHEIRLALHQVSTGQLHPEAQKPIIRVVTTRWERPAVGIEVVGDNLVLILAYYEHPSKPDDQVFVYNWKTAKLKMATPYHTYSGLLFLTEDIILLPNTNTGSFEFFKLPHDAPDLIIPQPFFALALPQLATDKKFSHISCRADPNPTSSFHHSSKPFHADPFHAIAIFTIHVRPSNMIAPGFIPHFAPSSSFVLFVHRSSLVKCLERFPEAISDTGDIEPVPYSMWGQDACRWFLAEALSTRWITTTAGQRCIIIQDINLDVERAPFILLNFNQKDVARVLEDEARDRQEKEKRLTAMVRPDDPIPDERHVFREIGYSSLSYTVCASKKKYPFDGVLIDEERIIGLASDPLQRIKTLDILHFG